MKNIRLTNGNETFLLGSVIEDEKGAICGCDSGGSGYTRCDIATCDHAEHKPVDAIAWHDDENTETFWEVA